MPRKEAGPGAGTGAEKQTSPGRGSNAATTVAPAPNEPRRILRRARRVLSAELGHDRVNPELLAAAELVCEAGGRRG